MSVSFGILSGVFFYISTEAFQGLIESLYGIYRGSEAIPREVKVLSIAVLESHESESSTHECFTRIAHLLDDITQSIKIFRAFRHFFIIHEEVTAVEPVFRELLSSVCLCLSDLVLMVREDEVYATHVYIYLLSEKVLIARATLDMPSWATTDFDFLSS